MHLEDVIFLSDLSTFKRTTRRKPNTLIRIVAKRLRKLQRVNRITESTMLAIWASRN